MWSSATCQLVPHRCFASWKLYSCRLVVVSVCVCACVGGVRVQTERLELYRSAMQQPMHRWLLGAVDQLT